MRQRWIRNACLTLAFVILPSLSAQALKAVLSFSHPEYAITDEVELEAKLENVGSEPVTIWGHLMWGYAGGFVLRIYDAAGGEVHPAAYDDDLLISSTLGDATNFVKLAPNHILGVLRTDRASDLFGRPGVYRIRVQYLSPVPLKYRNQKDFWSRERGIISSEFISIRINPTNPQPRR